MIPPKIIHTLTALLLLSIGADANSRKATNRIDNTRKWIALTFDDGPNNVYTEPILEVLERHQVKATFFQIGKNMKQEPGLSKLVLEKGHEIGNHSMTHPRLPELETVKAIDEEIRDFQTLAQSITGIAPKTFRAPYLKFDERVWAVLDELNLPAFNASIYADYKGSDNFNDPAIASAHADSIIAKVKSGTIILMHERKTTPYYLNEVVDKLKKAGFEFVILSELQANAIP